MSVIGGEFNNISELTAAKMCLPALILTIKNGSCAFNCGATHHSISNISLPHNSQFALNDETSQLWRWMLESVSTSSVCCLAV